MTTTKQTAKQFVAEQRRHEAAGEWQGDSLADMACECFNATYCDFDPEGDIWIDKSGDADWASTEQLVQFARFMSDRCNLAVEIDE